MELEQHDVVAESDREVERQPGRKSLLAMMRNAGVASDEQLRLAAAEAMANGVRLGEIVLQRGWIDEAGLARLLAEQWQLPFLADGQLPHDLTSLGPSSEQARTTGVCAFVAADGGDQGVLADPTEERIDQLRGLLDPSARIAVVTASNLERLIDLLIASERALVAQRAKSTTATAAAAAEQRSDQVLTKLDVAAHALSELRGHLKRSGEQEQQSEHELAECRRELAELKRELREQEHQVNELHRLLATEHELRNTARTQIAALLIALEDKS